MKPDDGAATTRQGYKKSDHAAIAVGQTVFNIILITFLKIK